MTPDRTDVADEPDEAGRIGDLVARLAAPAGPEGPDRRAQGRALRSLAGALTVSARRAGRSSVGGGRWLADVFLDIAPRIPVRGLATLRAQHHGLDGDDLAEALIAGAAKASGTVGAAGGALAAVEFMALPTLLTAPAQIAAETLLVAAIETKLIAELHEVYGAAALGTAPQRATAYVTAWTNRRGIDPHDPITFLSSVGGAGRRALRLRLIRRAGRNLTTLGPMMTGAVVGSVANHRETRRLGDEVRRDLRRYRR
jgi:hypothetical protein